MTEMTKEAFLQLQDELEFGARHCEGEETDNTDSRLKELESLMENAPWILILVKVAFLVM